MNRKYSLIFALLITGLIASNYYLLSFLEQENQYLETSVVSRVIDGDTLELQDGRKIRLLNINAPEKSDPKHIPSLTLLKTLENKTIQLEITSTDRYERSLARIYTPEYLNLLLVQEGLASKFLVENQELSQFAQAEAKAITEEKGIWKRSQHYNCFTTQIDKNKEIVTIMNKCQPITLKSWTLKDESTKTFIFPEITLQKDSEITVHTTFGNNTQTSIFLNSNRNIWNNDRDSLFLFDENEELAHYETYGY